VPPKLRKDGNVLKEKVEVFLKFAAKHYVAKTAYQPQYPEEEDFADALSTFPALSDAERHHVGKAITDMFWAGGLATFAVRFASFAIQRHEPACLRPAVIALLIDDDELDPRDLLRTLAVLNEAACIRIV
jgi:hypothetical protein